MTNLIWTKEAPTVPGWYWRAQTYKGVSGLGEPEMVRVQMRGAALHMCEPFDLVTRGNYETYQEHEWDVLGSHSIEYQWSGPIEPPKEGGAS